MRLGPAPLYTRFVDVWDAVDRCRAVLAEGAHETYPTERSRVT
jgi:kynureninase